MRAFALLFFAFCARAQPAAVPLELTLDRTIQLAVERNLDVALAEDRLAFLEAQRRQAIGAALPSVTIAGSYNRNLKRPSFFLGGQVVTSGADNGMRHAGVLQQYLFAGGAVSQGMKAARLGAEAGREQFQAARQDAVFAAQRLFYAVCLASETASIQREALVLAENHLGTIEERYRQGLDSDLTVLRQKVEVASAKPSLLAALNAAELALTMLKDLLAMDVDAPVSLSGSLEGPRSELRPYADLQQAALPLNPYYRAARRAYEQSEALVKVSQAVRWPFLSLYADAQWYSESNASWPRPNERSWSSLAGLRLDYPIFTGG
ncbi:MAG: TolC family protein, partial [Elusimicrobia bacterium]|nr:TolC family protein [Elusimicrobiota bacterium]